MLYDCTIEYYYYFLSDIVFNLIINICDNLKCIHNKEAMLNINFKSVFFYECKYFTLFRYTLSHVHRVAQVFIFWN